MSSRKGPKRRVARHYISVHSYLSDLCCHHPLKDPNIFLSCSNYGSKFNLISIKKIQGGPNFFFFKVNKYKILNYYIYIYIYRDQWHRPCSLYVISIILKVEFSTVAFSLLLSYIKFLLSHKLCA